MKSGHFHCHFRQLRRVETTRSGRSPSAAAAYDYILRRGDYAPKKLAKLRRKNEKDERLIFAGGFSVPAWGRGAKNEATKFWKTADEFERSNGRLALKIEVAIPRGVPRQKWFNLIEDFARKNFKDHPVSFAVHEGRAGDGGLNPHIHFLVSERKRDGIERSPELFFRRANPRDPAKGGAKKDRAWHDKDFFRRTRKSWADCCNKFLTEANADTRVDHRSFAERGINKKPTTHDGPHRRAMKARGATVRPRQAEVQSAELRGIDNQIRDLKFEKAAEEQRMKSQPTITTDREANAAVARAKIVMQNLPQPDPALEIEAVEVASVPRQREFQDRVLRAFVSHGWQVEWLPHVATSSDQLPAFRATHPQGFQIEFRPGRATASAATDEAMKALIYTAQQAGWKSVALGGPKDAREKMEILCRAAGIKVTNPVAGEPPGGHSPAVDHREPEPSYPHYHDLLQQDPRPATRSPVAKKTEPKKKRQKERDEIYRRVDDQYFRRGPVSAAVSDKAYEFSLADLRYTPAAKAAEWRCGHNLYEFAREVAAKNLDRYFIKRFADDKTGEGLDRLIFCMICDRGVDPERLRLADGLAIRHPSNRLTSAIKTFYSSLGEPPPEPVAAWLENRAPNPEAEPKHAAIPLEPAPE